MRSAAIRNLSLTRLAARAPKGALLRLDHNQFFRIQCTLHHFIDAVL